MPTMRSTPSQPRVLRTVHLSSTVPKGAETNLSARVAGEKARSGDAKDQSSDEDGADADDKEVGKPGKEQKTTPQESNTSSGDEQPCEAVQDFLVRPGQMIRFVFQPPPEEPPAPTEHPQLRMTKFWSNFEPEYEGGITQILPEPLATASVVKKLPNDSTVNAVSSYTQAREQCIRSVNQIIRECRALNQKYSDAHFDIESDLKATRSRDCLDSLGKTPEFYPQDVKRVADIFDSPEFYKNGAGYDDIIQGNVGDCWFLAALSALTANERLVQDVCVIQDQEVGVYGFVFYRDGEWQPCIIDDKLYLRAPAFEESGDPILQIYGVQHDDEEKKYNSTFQSGSKALYFAACRDENETWVPLLEKAFSKAHGDYSAIDGGWTGEALEDLTGGVTTELYTTNILCKDRFWKEDLSRIGKEFLFSCCMAPYTGWKTSNGVDTEDEVRERRERWKGIENLHAYAVLDVYEGFGERLVKIRNPWGHQEWKGPWSDGSPEWTSEWLQRLNHRFGNDGIFWIRYSDMLRKYKYLDRTRVFGAEWHIAQQWTSVQVPWSVQDYQQTKFVIDVPADNCDTVIVLQQIDDRYFQSFQGEYYYSLQFRVQEGDVGPNPEADYLARSPIRRVLWRSTNVELTLNKGRYTVLFKIEAYPNGGPEPEAVIRSNLDRKEKIIQTATMYDLAHAKGKIPDKEVALEEKSDVQVDTKGKDEEKAKPPQDAPADKNQTVEAPPPIQSTAPPPPMPSEDPKKVKMAPDENDPQRTPWNASCVVGLRVFTKNPGLQLKVVEPVEERKTAMDRDDIAKAALDEAKVATATLQKEDGDKIKSEKKEDSPKEGGKAKKEEEKVLKDSDVKPTVDEKVSKDSDAKPVVDEKESKSKDPTVEPTKSEEASSSSSKSETLNSHTTDTGAEKVPEKKPDSSDVTPPKVDDSEPAESS